MGIHNSHGLQSEIPTGSPVELEDCAVVVRCALPDTVGRILDGGHCDYQIAICRPEGDHFIIGLVISALYATDIHGQRIP